MESVFGHYIVSHRFLLHSYAMKGSELTECICLITDSEEKWNAVWATTEDCFVRGKNDCFFMVNKAINISVGNHTGYEMIHLTIQSTPPYSWDLDINK